MNFLNEIHHGSVGIVDGRIKKVCRDVFNAQDIRIEDSMETIVGWDSLGHTMLMVGIEKKFSVKFSFEEIVELTTIKKIQERLRVSGALK